MRLLTSGSTGRRERTELPKTKSFDEHSTRTAAKGADQSQGAWHGSMVVIMGEASIFLISIYSPLSRAMDQVYAGWVMDRWTDQWMDTLEAE